MTKQPTAPTGFIARLTAASVLHPWMFVGGALAVSAISIWLASGLRIDSSFERLLPDNVPSVQHVKELIKRVGGDGTVFVNIEAADPTGLKAAEALAPVFAKEFLAMGPDVIRAVDENLVPVERWYEDHWPLFASLGDLEKARDAVHAEVKQRKQAANPLAADLSDPSDAPEPPKAAAAAPKSSKLDEWLDPNKSLPREQVAARFANYTDGFMVHPDKKSLTLVVRPAGTSLGVSEAQGLVDRMRAVVDKHRDELAKDHLRVGFAGSFPVSVAEYEAVVSDVFGTALLVTSLVLGSILLYFRDLRSTIALGTAVLVAVAVTFGLTRLVIGYLNTQTSFLGAIVVGNGINYGLIYLARVKQLRKSGVGLLQACLEGAETTARATLLASAATSVSFGVLIIAANRGFRDFGFIGGLGMILCWCFTFALVPAVLSLWEKLLPLKVRPAPLAESLEGRVAVLRRIFPGPWLIVSLFAGATLIGALLFVRQIPTAMERNLDNLTNDMARGQDALRRDQDRAQTSLGKSIAGSIALLPTREAADAFCDVIDTRSKEPRYAPLIDGCTTLSSVVPRDQEKKLFILKQIIDDLPDSLISKLKPIEAKRLREVRDQVAAQKVVTAAEAPQTLVDRFRERDGSVGRLAVVTAKPLAHLEEGPNLQAFVTALRDVPVGGQTYEATGENVVLADLLKNIEAEGPRTTLFSFLGVCALVVIFFRRVRTSLEVMGSLFIGVLLMAGAAAALHIKINFFNFIVYPITFGIAVDYGANVAARVHERGNRVLEALAEVGPVVALCSWTSIIGYGSLLFSLNRALRSFGWYAMVGELTTISTALILLPALLLVERAPASDVAPSP